MEKESIFLTYIRTTLKKWTGFQVAIDEGMGGPYSREKEIWLGTEIEKYFKSYKDVKPEELEDYVGTMIENEFDTYFEDGSILEVCRLFCKAYNLSEVDPNAPMFQVLKKIPAASSRLPNISTQNEEITGMNLYGSSSCNHKVLPNYFLDSKKGNDSNIMLIFKDLFNKNLV